MSLIILAGGNSTRLNRDKAFLELIENKTIIENIVSCLRGVFSEIIIVANNLEDYKFLGFKVVDKVHNFTQLEKIENFLVVPDIVKGKGPLGGIYTGLKTSKDERNFALACDMPFVNIELVRYMLKFKEFDAVVPRFNGYTEPLHAVYSKKVLPIIENQLKNDELKINDTIKKIKKIKYIEKEEIEKFDKAKLCFFNINNEKDLEEAKRILNENSKIENF